MTSGLYIRCNRDLAAVELVTGSAAIDRKKLQAHGRSRVTNGKELLPNVDGRGLVARRYRDIASAIMTDQGGADRCSESRKQLIRRFAAASVLAEMIESKLANGEQIDLAQHATLSSTLVRLAARIGIERVPRDLTPTLTDYLREHAAEHANDEEEATEIATSESEAGAATHPAADETNEPALTVESARAVPNAVEDEAVEDVGDDYEAGDYEADE